jgi:hypothetical protein
MGIVTKRVVSAAVSSAKLTRTSSHIAMFVLSTSCGSTGRVCVLQNVLSALIQRISESGITAVSNEDIFKFMNPLEAISALSISSKSEDEIKITNADRKKDGGRNRRGIYVYIYIYIYVYAYIYIYIYIHIYVYV